LDCSALWLGFLGMRPGESHLEFRRHIGRVLRFE
jgi:hypothetical protein